MIGPVIALPWKIYPFGVTELVAHEIQVSATGSGKRDQPDQFMESHATFDDEGFAATVEGWAAEARADPELSSGDGFDANVAGAQQLLKDHGSDELADILAATGLGSHPAVVRFAARIARKLQGK